MLCLCLVSYHVVYSIGQLTSVSSYESLCVVGWGLIVVLSWNLECLLALASVNISANALC